MKKNSDNPFFKVNNFLNGRTCKKIIEEIDKFEKFDDLVMSGRKRINKGSENFNRFLKISKASKKFFNKINNFNFFKKIKPNLLKSLKKENWIYKADNLTFSKSLFGAQKGKRITNIKTNLRKNIMYLDMDFSVSEKGYNRGPHRDRDSRVINFLIYLNTLAKKDGGTLSFYQTKNKPSVSERKVMAVRSWESFRKGELIPVAQLTKVLNYLKLRTPTSLEKIDFDTLISYDTAKKHLPNLPNEYWYDVFTGVSVDERSYIRAMLRRGEKITKEPRIRLSTIHAAKGGEASNVILLTDISSRVYKSFQNNPDDESRVFYVGLTRAKESLYLIEPQTQKYFPL